MPALTKTSRPLTHTMAGEGPAAGFTISGRTNRIVDGPTRPNTPLIVAVHGGTYTSEYFDIPGHSLLERAADLEIPVISLDRPNYADSSSLQTDDSIILANAVVLADVLGEIWADHGAGTSGIVLVGHSIGSAVVIAIAAESQAWPLLGIAISGCLVRVPEQSRAAWESLPDIPLIDLPTPMRTRSCSDHRAATTRTCRPPATRPTRWCPRRNFWISPEPGSPAAPASVRRCRCPCTTGRANSTTSGSPTRTRSTISERVSPPPRRSTPASNPVQATASTFTGPAQLSAQSAFICTGMRHNPPVGRTVRPGTGPKLTEP